MNEFFYIRVSTKEQNTDRQMEEAVSRGIRKRNIYVDKMSGKDFDRPAYRRMVKRAVKGDLIIIKSIDRLGRNYDEILIEWRRLTKEKHVDIEVIDMPLLNTRSKDASLITEFISELVLQILAYVAQTEREFIRQRQAEGIRIAKAKGVRFGRKKRELPEEFDVYRHKFQMGEISVREASEALGMPASTFYFRCRDYSSDGNC